MIDPVPQPLSSSTGHQREGGRSRERERQAIHRVRHEDGHARHGEEGRGRQQDSQVRENGG